MIFHFVHINKTGGSSVEQALGIPFSHKPAYEVIEEVGVKTWERFFTFTIVRNPWDKVVSHYHYRTQVNGQIVDGIGFKDWVREAYGNQNPKYYENPKMFMPQMDWITDGSRKIIVNFVMRFENLAKDFELLCAMLGRRDTKLPHLKATNRGPFQDYYDEDTKMIVCDWFREDINRFRYKFEEAITA